MTSKRKFEVIDGPLGIRDTANGNRLTETLLNGTVIEVDEPSQTAGDMVWWKHNKGWSAEKKASTGHLYMRQLSAPIKAISGTFEVIDGPLGIRDTPNGTRLKESFPNGTKFDVDPASRTEAGGMIWWKHRGGWSAEGMVDGTKVFLREVLVEEDPETDDDAATTTPPPASTTTPPPATTTPPPATTTPPPATTTPPPASTTTPPPATTTPPPASNRGKVLMIVKTGVKIRAQPSKTGTEIRTLKVGEIIECDFATETFANDLYYVQHKEGWTAWKTAAGEMYLEDAPAGSVAPVPVGDFLDPATGLPIMEKLPGYKTLITRHPVAIADCTFWQYYGNNTFAYVYGSVQFGYDKYSQALHGGLDYGAKKALPIYAGLSGTVEAVEKTKIYNYRVIVRSGDWKIIYQHITNIRVGKGAAVTPDTVIAEIETTTNDADPNDGRNPLDHLHFEIRFKEKWIVNPLLLMSDAMVAEVTTKFKPDMPNTYWKKSTPDNVLEYFYKTPRWDKWTTYLDQPVIVLAGPVIGPRSLK